MYMALLQIANNTEPHPSRFARTERYNSELYVSLALDKSLKPLALLFPLRELKEMFRMRFTTQTRIRGPSIRLPLIHVVKSTVH